MKQRKPGDQFGDGSTAYGSTLPGEALAGWADTIPQVKAPRRSPDGTITPETGCSIGRYEILGRLGSGGMGDVYRAIDPQLRRQIAIKVLKLELGRTGAIEELRQRLLREGQALAKVSDPNVVAVYDVGLFRGQVFVAMELVRGRALSDWLREEQRSADEIVTQFLGVASGLAAAHRVGLVHRDVKPDNAVVGDDGRVRVLDFGLARGEGLGGPLAALTAIAPSVTSSDPLTKAGLVMGTPAYIAPEQLAGDAVEERTDQFSFCVALWEALSGTLPFAGASLAERADAIKRGGPFQGVAKVPRSMRKILVRGLSEAPADRHASMDSLASELRKFLNRGRNRRLALLGVIALLFISLSGLAEFKGLVESAPEKHNEPGLEHFDTASQTRILDNMLTRAFAFDNNSDPERAKDLLDTLLKDPRLPDTPDVAISALGFATQLYTSLHEGKRAEASANRMLVLAREIGDDQLLLSALGDKLVTNAENRTGQEMEKTITDTLAIARDIGSQDALLKVDMYTAWAHLRRSDGAAAEASSLLVQARVEEVKRPELRASAFDISSRVALYRENFLSADSLAIKGLAVCELGGALYEPDCVSLMMTRAAVKKGMGEHVASVALVKAAFADLAKLPTDMRKPFLLQYADDRIRNAQWEFATLALDELNRTATTREDSRVELLRRQLP